MKDARRTSFAEFEKIWLKSCCEIDIDCKDLDCRQCKFIAQKWWKEALKWIYYEGVLDHSLAGDLIKKELRNEI